ncbi:MAG: hypothetical protein Q9219_001212 [cf. Caloplaca sp. 3 TL-2023]
MTILLTGGRGKTSLRIASLLSRSSPQPIPYILASPSGTVPSTPFLPASPPPQACRFDWNDRSTWKNPWETASPNTNIKAVYLVSPGLLNPLEVMEPFIRFAREKGTKRFVLLSASSIEEGGPLMGEVHGYLGGLGREEGVEWCVLRPTWFMENFSEMTHLPTIRDEGRLFSATGEGKVPWVSAGDIAGVAVRALVDERSHDCEYVVVGGEVLGYRDIAAILSDVLGRKITHVDLTEKELAERYVKAGLDRSYAEVLSGLDSRIRSGEEEIQNEVVGTLVGVPKTFRAFAEENKGVWQ